ncbi:hypothetical protein F4777DRAFT_423433 [Nemania sp. FL0916]|nr:hypothetical protein F4777DRAFT_423433 [Nemania sp. FL0916]
MNRPLPNMGNVHPQFPLSHDVQRNGAQMHGAQNNGAQKSGGEMNGAQMNDAEKSSTEKSGTEKSDTQMGGAKKSGAEKSGAKKRKSGTEKIGAQMNVAHMSSAEESGGEKNGAEISSGEINGTGMNDAGKSGTQKNGAEESGAGKSGAEKSETSSGGPSHSPIVLWLKERWPSFELTIAPGSDGTDLAAFAHAGYASRYGDSHSGPGVMMPPVATSSIKLCYSALWYIWSDYKFLVFRAGINIKKDIKGDIKSDNSDINWYILSDDRARNDELVSAARAWGHESSVKAWQYEKGQWKRDLVVCPRYSQFRQPLSWNSIVMDEAMKRAILAEHRKFF